MVVVQSVILMKLQTKFYHMRDITCRDVKGRLHFDTRCPPFLLEVVWGEELTGTLMNWRDEWVPPLPSP